MQDPRPVRALPRVRVTVPAKLTKPRPPSVSEGAGHGVQVGWKDDPVHARTADSGLTKYECYVKRM